MGLIDYIRDKRAKRRVIAESRSLDWGVAESAIQRVPEVLDSEVALQVLLPLSRGECSRLVNPLAELPAILTYEFSAGVHISSAIAALGKLKSAQASARLVQIVTDLPNFALSALSALGSPYHGAFASQLASVSAKWPRKLRSQVCNALWHMQTDEALDIYIRMRLEDGSLASEETMRKAWADKMEEIRNPSPWKKEPTKVMPLPP